MNANHKLDVGPVGGGAATPRKAMLVRAGSARVRVRDVGMHHKNQSVQPHVEVVAPLVEVLRSSTMFGKTYAATMLGDLALRAEHQVQNYPAFHVIPHMLGITAQAYELPHK